ncbi:MAG: gliding motility-associated C-terminal domain-containing protein [Bacteroidota bacterium]
MCNIKLIIFCNNIFRAFSLTVIALCLHLVSGSAEAQNKTSSLTLDSVSVDHSNGNVIIGWTLETDVLIGNIEIHRRHESGEYTPIATLALDENLYIDNGANANNRAYAYYVVARDESETSFAVSYVHKTSYLNNVDVNICENKIYLDWENYEVTTSAGQPQPQPSPFDIINIWTKFNDDEWQKIMMVNNETNNIAFDDFEAGNHCFFLENLNTTSEISSSSNKKCINVDFLDPPEFAYLQKVSVIGDNNIEIAAFVDNEVKQAAYVLLRSANEDENFAPIDTVFSNNEYVEFIDEGLNVYSDFYNYKIEVLDSCMNSRMISNTANSILLEAKELSYNENKLNWNSYEGWHTGVEAYEIYRITPGDVDFLKLITLDASANSYTDRFQAEDLIGDDQVFVYTVVAVENENNPFGSKSNARSNTAGVEREPEIFVPTAFKPNSNIAINRVFKPNFGYYQPSDYYLLVFNRWGNVVFVSDDYANGWDGSYNGAEADQGAYSYLIKWKNSNGKEFEQKGVVNLIR